MSIYVNGRSIYVWGSAWQNRYHCVPLIDVCITIEMKICFLGLGTLSSLNPLPLLGERDLSLLFCLILFFVYCTLTHLLHLVLSISLVGWASHLQAYFQNPFILSWLPPWFLSRNYILCLLLYYKVGTNCQALLTRDGLSADSWQHLSNLKRLVIIPAIMGTSC